MSEDLDVALATCRVLPEPDPEAVPLLEALRAAGLRAAWWAWDDPDVEWSRAAMTVLRSTWNYPQEHEAFRRWVGKVSSVSRLENPRSLVETNLHKGYLLDLERDGVRVTPTELVARGSAADLAGVMRRRGWARAVVKPAISAASWRTMDVGADELERGNDHLRALLADGDALVQEYVASVRDYGERAIVVIEGEPTHAVRKTPRFSGDDESVSDRAVPISAEERGFVAGVVARWERPPLYARVDVAPGADGRPQLMELELIEPSLFLTHSAEAMRRFVDAIKHRLPRAAGGRTG